MSIQIAFKGHVTTKVAMLQQAAAPALRRTHLCFRRHHHARPTPPASSSTPNTTGRAMATVSAGPAKPPLLGAAAGDHVTSTSCHSHSALPSALTTPWLPCRMHHTHHTSHTQSLCHHKLYASCTPPTSICNPTRCNTEHTRPKHLDRFELSP